MASNFSSLRNSRKSALAKLADEAKKESQKGGGADERFWKLTYDAKTKIGYAKIRFLPAPKGEELPWVRVFSHGFQGPGGQWYFENCPTTLGQRPCPVCKDNNKLWNSGIEADKEVSRRRKRKLQFISNILVIEDPAKPDNNGKVFLFKYGAKIHDKIKELIEPEFPDAEPANPFDLWEGADFKLKTRDVMGYLNYDKSDFADPAELFPGDDDAKEAVWEKEYSLQAFVAESEFKNFDELEKRFNEVLNGEGKTRTAEDAIKGEVRDEDVDAAVTAAQTVEKEEKKAASRKPARKPAPPVEPEAAALSDDDEDEIKSFFSGLKDED
jgi:hypothetical protein